MSLRPYQCVTCGAANKSLEHQHTLVQSPTGTGKTEMALELSEMAVRRVAGPVIVVAPTDEIFGQMISRYQRAGWMVHADKAERRARPSIAMEQALDGAKVVIVASQQTLAMRDRIERYPRNGWALPILDECHHAPAATWQGIREYFDQPWLGLSATPERAGMRNLWPQQILAFPGGLMEAINEGWLVPFEHHYAAGVTLDDYEALQSNDARDVDGAIERSIATLLDLLKAGPGLAFWPRVRAAKQAAKFLRSMTPEVTARALAGKGMPRDERRLALRQYAAGTLRMLSLCNVGVEGLDVPSAAAGLIMQMTKVRSRVAQMMGRFLRPLAECLRGLDEAPAEERRATIAASAKPLARVASIAPPDVIDGWETPGMLLWGHLPEPVLIDIDRRQREGRDLETAKREAIEAEADREARRKAAREKHDRDLAAAAPARAAAVDRAQPYELRDHADAAHAARRMTLGRSWLRWGTEASATMNGIEPANRASAKQARAIAKLVAEYMRQPHEAGDLGHVGAQVVLQWDSRTAGKALQALRHMCGHTSAGYRKQRA